MTIIAAVVVSAISAFTTPSFAQDVRGRSVTTVVQDALAQMPVENKDVFNTEMKYLADCAPETVTILAGMLQSADKGANDLIEYALNGLCNYASNPANKVCLEKVKAGFEQAAKACEDKYNKAFLESQIRLLTPSEVKPFEEYSFTSTAKEALKALKSSSRKTRVTTLEACLEPDVLCPMLEKKFKSFSDDAKVDVLNYAGTFKREQLCGLAMKALGSCDGKVADAAAIALSKLGGNDAALALLNNAAKGGAVFDALSSIKADKLQDYVVDAISNARGEKLQDLLKLAGNMHMTGAADKVFSLLDNAEVSKLAKETLKGVVSANDASKIAGLLDAAKSPDEKDAYCEALKAAISSLSASERFDAVSKFLNAAKNPELFYPALAFSGTREAVKYFSEKNTDAAKASLALVDNKSAIDPLVKIGTDGSINAAVELMKKYIDNKDNLSLNLSSALEAARSKDVKSKIIGMLSSAPTLGSFLAAGKYLDDGNLKFDASNAVRTIASRCIDDIDYDVFVNYLTKAKDNYEKRGYADDGYAIKEIDKMVSEAVRAEYVSATPEELAEGFEVLFDGKDMDKWEGNLAGYTPVNGNIYVSAFFGNDMNLYTKKEYKDFVLRFEFTFTRPGVNNGIGIRTPEGVDAAYFGMCECQVLDHDDPMYKGLRPYQVHGSIYGLIPAKRVVHKPLGEWGTEEIRVEGDHIKVTVNGEVIVDADIREACQGHNVSPTGHEPNEYTVDHRDHPGMFNEKGHISFCGHGVGMMYRNVRVLDLSAKNAATAKTKKSKKK